MAKWIPTKKTAVEEVDLEKAFRFRRSAGGNNQGSFRPLAPILDQTGMNTFQNRNLS